MKRLRIRLNGIVQGVGFRPFVYNLAVGLSLKGYVRNGTGGVEIDVEGEEGRLKEFLRKLEGEKPPPAIVFRMEVEELPPVGYGDFRILKSEGEGERRVWILPDLAICDACLRELFDPEDRRYLYPFINCTHCGPRFTIIEDLPYDRPNTSMKVFAMCEECRREYEDPTDRRFHAQPIACPVCGPTLFWKAEGEDLKGEEAFKRAVEYVREGKIIAVKGLGGYHIILDARSNEAVAELRRRKGRPTKPFAVMYPDVETLSRHVSLNDEVIRLLLSPQSPIVLLKRKPEAELSRLISPSSPYLGVFLPYTPLHRMLLRELKFPVVATSANVSGDLIEYRDEEALKNLKGLVDGILYHDRPIVRHADDSVLIYVGHRQFVKARRARGYVPVPLLLKRVARAILAVGGHMNATFAITRGREVIVSQHFGDLEGLRIREAYRRGIEDFLRLYDVRPEVVAYDMHPDYFTTHLAKELTERWGVPGVAVQHHHAHLSAVALEYGIEGEVLAFTWDGTGYGTDGTVWGGEALLGDFKGFKRVATLRPFRLPGGERAVKEPWRVALSLLYGTYGGDIPPLPFIGDLPGEHVRTVLRMVERGINSPITTSIGRLFDGFAALLGLILKATYQAEAPQVLEGAAYDVSDPEALPFEIYEEDGVMRLDWRPAVRRVVEGTLRGENVGRMAAGFHAMLAEWMLRVAEGYPGREVVCGGGVFLNAYLISLIKQRLKCLLPVELPPTDGGLSAGQVGVAMLRPEALQSPL